MGCSKKCTLLRVDAHLHSYRKIILEIRWEEEVGLFLRKARFPYNQTINRNNSDKGSNVFQMKKISNTRARIRQLYKCSHC